MPDATHSPSETSESERGRLVALPSAYRDESPSNNLPLAVSSFVGREKEMAEVKRLLEDARLLTLTGSGGCGKTKLALVAAGDLVEGFEDGVWLVELASLADSSLVPRAVASVLGMREQPGRSPTETLSDYLRARKLLLVMDNCEHLIEACATLAETLLRSCPELRVLSTSREALGITGEVALPVPSLSFPDLRRPPDIESLPRYESVRLFVERAAAVKPDFALTEHTALAVARICCRLDGIPLALELAAARAKVLPAEQISARLDDCFGLLSAGGRTAMPRHGTLRATMDWSHDLLGREEGNLLRRLSVFSGGFSLEAAESVCAVGELESYGILDPLTHLIDKSLVAAREEEGGEARYGLLETVRQYGSEKLEEAGEAGKFRERHADYYLALAEVAEPELRGGGQVAWLGRLERDHDNLRSAMAWLLEDGEIETAVRFAWMLQFFWYLHGYQSEGRRHAGEALEKGDVLPTGVRAKALFVRAFMSYGLDGTMRLFEESAALFRRAGDKSGLAMAMGGMGLTTLQQGAMERATALSEETIKLHREAGDKWGVSSILVHMGIIALATEDYALAARRFEESLALSRETGDRLIGYISRYNLAIVSQIRGDHERAAGLYIGSLEFAVELGDKVNTAYSLEGLARVVAARGEPERAVRLFGASEALLESVGAPLFVHAQDRALYERAVEGLRSQLGETGFEAPRAEGRAMSLEQAVEYALSEAESATPEASSASSYPAGLSGREVDVLRLVATGMTNAEAAKKLFISPRTVNWHLGSIYRKLGFSSRTEATRFAVEHGLL